jgi:hypothetical protein
MSEGVHRTLKMQSEGSGKLVNFIVEDSRQWTMFATVTVSEALDEERGKGETVYNCCDRLHG